CECDPDGTISGGICVSQSDPALGSVAGQCLCKENVEGAKCDRCKPNHYRLSATDPVGCQPRVTPSTSSSPNCHPAELHEALEVSGSGFPLRSCMQYDRHAARQTPAIVTPLGVCPPRPVMWIQASVCASRLPPDHTVKNALYVSAYDFPFVGYWGLENHPQGCTPCDCDIGGAYSTICSPEDGQCECRPHVTGPGCTEPAPGYFFAPLDFYLYEAEEATPLQGLAPLILATALPTCDVYFQQQGNDVIVDKGNVILKRNQKPSTPADLQLGGKVQCPGPALRLISTKDKLISLGWSMASLEKGSVTSAQVPAVHIVFPELAPGTPVTWTGPGFAKVPPGAGLRFAVDNIPFPMDFAIAIRYEIQSAADWSAQIMVNPSGRSKHCTHKTRQPRPRSFALPAASRVVLLPTPICLEPDVQYSIDVYFSQPLEGRPHTHSHILVDSLGLIPQINSLENFCSKQDLDEYQLHNCVEIASDMGPRVLPGACERLIVSMSAKLHNGAVACKCHPQGSAGPSCSRLGGQCPCKPGVAGRCCDRCSPGSYACHCHPQGSKNTVCDQVTGECPCQEEVAGRRCDRCLAGYFGFPNCRRCLCNGFAELCDPETGSCFNCRGFTTGRNCERCIDGYYGNPSSGQSCHPCPCPDVPSSDQYFASSCYQNPWSSDVICNCLQGYAGKQCGECSAGFYGNPRTSGAPCQPCACNNNIDVTDPEACSPVTGECLRCLHNTQGTRCQLCRPGYFGSAINQTCRRCSCHPSGVNPAECPPGRGACLCDPDTGTCPCLPNVTGQACDHCAGGYWNLVPGRGCQPCDCDPGTSRSQCPCKLGHDGKRCSECNENYYSDPLGRCLSCDCNREGTQRPMCDQGTGMCHCREGVSGQRCDRCAQGHGHEFPACLRCHLCFDQWDNTISFLSKAVQGLIRLAANMEDKRETLPVCEANFKGLRENLSEIERILKHPVFSSGEFLKVKDYHDSVRRQTRRLSEQLKTVYEFQDLKEILVRIRSETDLFLENLQEEIDLHSSVRNASIMDASENIKKYYQRSLSAEKKTNETTAIINNSEKTRWDLRTIVDTLTTTGNLSLEKLKQIRIPNSQILYEKVNIHDGTV
ncbi:hypothetical protein MC885_018429, partial [Smutsia gigantea]